MALNTDKATSPNNTLSGEVRNVGKHSMIYMLAPAISKIIGFLLFPLYTSFISTSNYGVSSLIEVAMTFAMLVMSVNLADGMTRFYYATQDELQRRRVVSSVIAGIALIGLPIVVLFAGLAAPIATLLRLGPEFVSLLRVAFVASWFSMLAEIGFAYLRMTYKSKTYVATTVVQILLFIGLNVLFVVVYRLDIWGIFYSTLIVQGLLGIGLSASILCSLKTFPDRRTFMKLIRFGAPLMPSTVSQQLNNYIHPMMLQWLSVSDPLTASAQVGLFAAGQKMGVVVNRFLVVPFNGFWRPRRMELVMRKNDNVNRIIAKMCTYSTALTAAFALIISAVAESALQIMDELGWVGDVTYLDAHLVVPLIALAYTIHSLEHHFATGMHASGRTGQATGIGVLALLATIAANWLLIPWLGFIGAAIATNVGVTIRSLAFLRVSQQKILIPFEMRRIGMAILTAIGLFLIIRVIEFHSIWATLGARSIVALAYGPILFVVGFFDKRERAELSNACSRFARTRSFVTDQVPN